MDNVTHTITGLFLSRAGLHRVTPAATPILLLAANIPDCDVISGLAGASSYLHWHRNFTHSILFAPVLALSAVVLVKLSRMRFAIGPAFAVALTGVASHLLLDLTNVYGVRLLLPFSGKWFHWDLTPVIDFWLWGVFLVCLAGPFLSKLVSSEIGAAQASRRHTGRGFAVLGLTFLLAYDFGRLILHARATGILEAREYANSTPLRVAAFPISENPLLWKGLAETREAYHLFQLNVLSSFDPTMGEIEVKAPDSPTVDAANRTDAFKSLRDFADYPLYRVIPGPDSGSRVELSDLRFGFTSVAILDRQNRVVKSTFSFGPQ